VTWVVVLFVSCCGRACHQLAADALCLFNGDGVYVCAISHDIWVLQCREMVTSAIDIAILPNRYESLDSRTAMKQCG